MRSMEEKEKIIYSPRGHHNIYNIGKIIESFAEFHKNNPDWKLYLSGTEHPENTPRYKKRVAELNLSEHVHFLGFVSQDENAEILARSKIMVSVPVSDGRAHSVMEAMGAGCVCFVSDIPTNYELIAHGVNGFLVEDHHLIDFAQYDSLDYDFLKKFNATKASGFTIENSKQCFLQLYK